MSDGERRVIVVGALEAFLAELGPGESRQHSFIANHVITSRVLDQESKFNLLSPRTLPGRCVSES